MYVHRKSNMPARTMNVYGKKQSQTRLTSIDHTTDLLTTVLVDRHIDIVSVNYYVKYFYRSRQSNNNKKNRFRSRLSIRRARPITFDRLVTFVKFASGRAKKRVWTNSYPTAYSMTAVIQREFYGFTTLGGFLRHVIVATDIRQQVADEITAMSVRVRSVCRPTNAQ